MSAIKILVIFYRHSLLLCCLESKHWLYSTGTLSYSIVCNQDAGYILPALSPILLSAIKLLATLPALSPILLSAIKLLATLPALFKSVVCNQIVVYTTGTLSYKVSGFNALSIALSYRIYFGGVYIGLPCIHSYAR